MFFIDRVGSKSPGKLVLQIKTVQKIIVIISTIIDLETCYYVDLLN